MKSVEIVKMFLTVLACICVLKGVCVASPLDQDGGGNARGTIQHTRESLLLLRALLSDSSECVCDLPEENCVER